MNIYPASFTRYRICVAVCILGLHLLSTSAVGTPVILNHSIHAEPGSIFCLQGDDFGASPRAWVSINGGAAAQVATLNSGDNTLTAQLPFAGSGSYSVFVRGASGDSAPVLLNQAVGTHFDTPEIAPGATFRLFGRNLYHSAAFTPRVDLVNVATSTVYATTIGASPGFYSLSVTAPAGLPLGTYDVWVSNGAGDWNSVKSRAELQLIVRAAGTDHWNLGVGWAADLDFHANRYNVKTDPRLTLHAVGDGVANDLAAINAAITKANADGGGVVYLPAGTYKVVNATGGNLVVLRSRTVLEGDGMNATIIKYGYGTPATGQHFGLLFNAGGSRFGAANLQLFNVNESGTWRDSIYTSTGSPSNRYFLSNVRHEKSTENTGSSFAGDRVVIQGCVVNGSLGPLLMNGTNIKVSGNTLTHAKSTAISVGNCSQVVVEGNIINHDGSATTDLRVRHSITADFTNNAYIADNTIGLINGPDIDNNDTESILSEGGGANRAGESTGTVVSATGSTVVVDNSASFVAGTVLCIVHGKGRGQWQNVIARSGTSITIGGSWAVPPDSTSRYAMFKWSTRNVTIFRNTLSNKRRGIWIYTGSSTDLAIANNTFTEADGIYLRPDQRLATGRFNVIYDTQVIGNTVSQSSGARPAMIALTQQQVNPSTTWGTGALNVEFRKNHITGSNTSSFPPSTNPFRTEGYTCQLNNESAPYSNQSIPALLGTVFQWNQSTNIAVANFNLNTGSYRTAIANNPLTTAAKVRNTTLNGASHTSVGTFFRATPDISVTASAPPAAEFGLAPSSFTLTRTGPTDADVGLAFNLGGTATVGTDYAAPPSNVIIPPGAASTTVTITPVADTLAEGDETVAFALATDSLGNYAPSLPATATLTLTDLPTDAWRFTNFSAAELTNSSISGDNADPDADGIPNLIERRLLLNPRIPSLLNRLPSPVISAGRLRISYRRAKGLTDLVDTVEVTGNLVNSSSWSSAPADVQLVPPVLDHGDGTETLTFEDQAAAGTPRFMRLKVTRLPSP